jgi:membrane-bound lytic murein transglycosylase D
MLSKNLVKQGFINHGWLLLLPATTVNVDPHFTLKETKPSLNAVPARNLNDTVKAVLADSFTTAKAPAAPEIQLNRHASKFVKSFIQKEDEFLQKMKLRSENYFASIETVLCKYDLPAELKYLAVVESELRPNAVSRVGAKGMWQLMPVTARELGLKVSGKYDERLQTHKSTVAAAKYLRDLYAQFGDWLLVLAAYNSGPGTVQKAIKKAGSKNFWALQQYLPQESRGHVKRFIGIHYFFEGQGSIATQTKSEALAYQKQLEQYTKEMEAYTASLKTAQTMQVSKDTVVLVAINTISK